jgi:1-acyl-sn-glycerol-3-phosphate acyltransferase
VKPNNTYRIAKVILPPIMRVYFRLSVKGRRNVPRTGGLLIVANHCSHLDPMLLGCFIPRDVSHLARSDLFRNRAFAWIIRKLGALPLARGEGDRQALEAAVAMLQGGQAITIFPEGTRSPDGKLQPAKPGAALIAIKAGVPIICAHLKGTFEAMGRGKSFPRPRRIKIRWGVAKTPEQWLEGHSGPERPTRALMDRLMEELKRLASS